MSNDDQKQSNPFMDWMNMWGQASQAAAQNPAMHESVKAWQESLRGAIEETVRGEAFLKQVGMQLEASQVFQEALSGALETQLKAMQLPTAKDIKEIRSRMRQLDDRLEDVSEQLDTVIDHLKVLTETTQVLARAAAAEQAPSAEATPSVETNGVKKKAARKSGRSKGRKSGADASESASESGAAG